MKVPTIKASDILRKDFEVVDINETLSRCLGIFDEKHPRVLIVYDLLKGKYMGLITERWILRSRLDPTKAKVKSVYRPAPKVALDTSVYDLARLMVENDVRHLPVFKEGDLVGIVTDEAIMRKMVKHIPGKVDELMTRNPITIDSTESIARAIALMRENGIARLPVLSYGKVTGIITMHDIVREILEPRVRASLGEIVGEKKRPLRDPVSSVMKKDILTIMPKDTISRAIRIMVEKDVSSLIVTEDGRLVGLLTRTDILQKIAKMGPQKPKIMVQLSVKDPDDFGMADLDKDKLLLTLESFARHHSKFLGEASITIFIKRHKERKRDRRLTHVRIQINSSAGQFVSVGEGWGVNQAVKKAIENLDRRIRRERERQEMIESGDVLLEEALGLLA
jgi:predicted transcriptional regulator/ribosome-associated translation inhibitor RaiA